MSHRWRGSTTKGRSRRAARSSPSHSRRRRRAEPPPTRKNRGTSTTRPCTRKTAAAGWRSTTTIPPHASAPTTALAPSSIRRTSMWSYPHAQAQTQPQTQIPATMTHRHPQTSATSCALPSTATTSSAASSRSRGCRWTGRRARAMAARSSRICRGRRPSMDDERPPRLRATHRPISPAPHPWAGAARRECWPTGKTGSGAPARRPASRAKRGSF